MCITKVIRNNEFVSKGKQIRTEVTNIQLEPSIVSSVIKLW